MQTPANVRRQLVPVDGNASPPSNHELQVLQLHAGHDIEDQVELLVVHETSFVPLRCVAHGRHGDVDLEALHAGLDYKARRPVLHSETHPVHVALVQDHLITEACLGRKEVDVLDGELLLRGQALSKIQDGGLPGHSRHFGRLRKLRLRVHGAVGAFLYETDPNGFHQLRLLGVLNLLRIHVEHLLRRQLWILGRHEVLRLLELLQQHHLCRLVGPLAGCEGESHGDQEFSVASTATKE
mmetsp:Transcript_50723/g.113889  ORF Transcript_50723/g.113889 Transcript_50723/m.113889 type:complete len:239 (-) Transcript_50723:47-763(-)